MDLPKVLIQDEVRRALLEDLGRAGDLSTQATIDPKTIATGLFVARDAGVVCGLPHAALAFEALDSRLLFEQKLSDGDHVTPGTIIASVSGTRDPFYRLMDRLNFMCHLSGIMTLTSQFVFRSPTPTRGVLYSENVMVLGHHKICRSLWWGF